MVSTNIVGHPSLPVDSNTIILPLKMKTCFWVIKLAVSLEDKFQFQDLQGWRTLLTFMNLSRSHDFNKL